MKALSGGPSKAFLPDTANAWSGCSSSTRARMLVTEYPCKKVRVDGALLDPWRQRRGFWGAKDANDDREKEIRKKIDSGYPTTNIIFQAPECVAVPVDHLMLNGLRNMGKEHRDTAQFS